MQIPVIALEFCYLHNLHNTNLSYNITVTVLDRGQPQFSETNYLFIEVTDVNDVEPELERV